MLFNCPPGSELPDVTIEQCLENFGQTVRYILMRLKNGAVTNKITGADTKLAWDNAIALEDSGKVVFSPEIAAPNSTPGDARFYGGGNQTPGGVRLQMGANPGTFEYEFLAQPQSTIEQLKLMAKERKVGIFLVNDQGVIAGKGTGTANEIQPFPINAFFVSDKKLGGFEEPDKNLGSFDTPAGWSAGFTMVVPSDFDALLDY